MFSGNHASNLRIIQELPAENAFEMYLAFESSEKT